MKPSIVIEIAKSSDDIADVKAIFLDYLRFIEDYLGESLSFQGTEAEFADFPNTYEAIFLAKIDGEPVAACGVKPFKPKICELKRLYCRPEGRGQSLGLQLTKKAIIEAQSLGYAEMYLDTDRGLVHANSVYESLGFKDIERYYENPMGCSRYMALTL
jgi:GNAT superfamily N-acetyltransferase